MNKEDVLTLFVFIIFQNVKEGMLILGCVKEVTDFEVTVSLPCGLQGYLSIKNICESYAKQLAKLLDADDSEVGLHFDVCRPNYCGCLLYIERWLNFTYFLFNK